MAAPLSIGKSRSFILTIGDDGGILIYMEGKKVLRRMFSASPALDDVKHFDSLLRTDPQAPISILIDTMDQTYVHQTLPPVSPLSINKLIQRRLDRDFSASDIKGAIALGRSSEGRKEWNYLFISVANISPISDWIAFAIDHPNPFRGVFLLPVEAEHLLRKLLKVTPSGTVAKKPLITVSKPKETPTEGPDAPSRWQIIVSHHKVGGFRQIVFRDNKLMFTRLSQPVGEALAEVIAGNIEQELVSTTEYLKRLAFNPASGLDVTVIVASEIRKHLTLDNSNFRRVNIRTPHEVAELLGLSKATEESDHFGDVIFAAYFGMAPTPRLRFTTPHIDQILQLHVVQKALKSALMIGVPLLMALIGWQVWEVFSLTRDIGYAQEKLTASQQRLSDLQTQKAALPGDFEQIMDTVAVYEFFTKQPHNPLTTVGEFSKLLNDDTLVQKLDWSVTSNYPGSRRPMIATAQPVEANFTVEFLNNDGSVDAFLARTDQFYKAVSEAFKDYKVTFASIPGITNREKSMEVDFNKKTDLTPQLPSKDMSVTYTISGPQKQPENGGTP